MAVEADRITVFFESQGYKTLARAVISEHGLLRESFTGFTGVRP
jgi:hypothetical protein